MKKKRQTAGASAGASHQRRRRESDDSDDSEVSEDSDDSDESDDDGVDEIAGDENVSDMDYLRKRAAVGSFSDSEDEDEDGSEDEDEDGSDEDDSDDEDGSDEDDEDGSDENGSGTPADGDSKPGDARVVTAEDMEAVADTGRVFVRNLPFTATEEEVAAHFARHGALTAVHIIVDRATRRSKGLAYITYALPENGMKAMEDLDGTIFQGRLIQCLPAKRPPAADATLGGVGRAGMEGTGDGDGDGDGKRPQTEAEREAGFKAARDARLKADAGTNRAAWNTLFMRTGYRRRRHRRKVRRFQGGPSRVWRFGRRRSHGARRGADHRRDEGTAGGVGCESREAGRRRRRAARRRAKADPG